MGLSFMKKNCPASPAWPAPAPNPDPSRWELLCVAHYDHAYVMKVRYLDCTNFEGVKVMVYLGSFPFPVPSYVLAQPRDPQFSERIGSPIARFRPDDPGWRMACDFARSL